MPLLKAKIFNPHMCNIANNPFTEKIPYAKGKNPSIGKNADDWIEFSVKSKIDPYFYYFKRDRVNLSLLNAVIKQMIKKSNTTIMDCSMIYNRFGFECRPITISEGQEIVRKIYEKTKHKIEPTKPKNKPKTKGKFAQITFTGYDYNFESKEEPFLTNAQMNFKLEDIKSKNKSKKESINQTISIAKSKSKLDEQVTYENMILSDMLIVAWLRDKLLIEITGERNKWCRVPLGETFFRRIERPSGIKKRRRMEDDYVDVQEYTETELWKSYKIDFKQMGIQIKAISHAKNILGETCYTIAISLDDIADLPIDLDKIHMLSSKEIDKLEAEER